MKLRIFLKSGQNFAVNVSSYKWEKNYTNRTLTWETPKGYKAKLVTVAVDEIEAIVEEQ